MVARSPGTLAGLLGLSIIHFARWVMIRRDQWPELGQASDAEQRLHAVLSATSTAPGTSISTPSPTASRTGSTCSGTPAPNIPHSIPITPFKNYIRANQIDTDYYYNATPGAAQRDIKAAMRVRRAIPGWPQSMADVSGGIRKHSCRAGRGAERPWPAAVSRRSRATTPRTRT